MGLIPLVNGRAYSWADIKINIGGNLVQGITAIKYDEEQEKEDQFGAGNLPVERGYGNKKATASMTLLASEVVGLQKSAPNKNICDIAPFDIVVAVMNTNGAVTTDVIKNCEFTKNSRDVKQNDKKIEVELPLICSHILWDNI